MNRLQKLSEKNLKLILKMIYNSIESFGRPRDILSYTNQDLIREELGLIGINNVDDMEMSFLLQLYKSNPNYETDTIKIPRLNKFEVKTMRSADVREKQWWVSEYETFLEEEDSFSEFLSETDDYEWWDGDMVDSETYNEETISTEVDDVKKIS